MGLILQAPGVRIDGIKERTPVQFIKANEFLLQFSRHQSLADQEELAEHGPKVEAGVFHSLTRVPEYATRWPACTRTLVAHGQINAFRHTGHMACLYT